jgi:predicted amino acid racemase
MAYVKFYRDKLEHNYRFLDELFKKNGIEWGVTTKLLCGYEEYLNEVIALGPKEILDSRVSNLKAIKKVNSDVRTGYIKPPPKESINEIIEFADVSYNTELSTIKMLSKEAVRQKKHHDIIIMIEMGDLREGVMREELLHFYEQIFELPNISVVGLGTNLNCLHGVMPSKDKLIQLSLYKQLIELKFKKDIPFVSGGTTVTIPLLLKGEVPKGINHFRVGEGLFFGIDLFTNKTIEGMESGVLELYTQIIELTEKPMVPSGELGTNPQGEKSVLDESLYGKTHYRAIIDIGYLDINPDFLIAVNREIKIVDASSDMLVLDVGENDLNYKVGDIIRFQLKYMGALGLMNSNYIEKRVE